MANRAAAEPFPSLSIDRVIDPKVRRFQVRAGGDGLSIFVPHPRFWIRSIVRWGHRAQKKVQEAFTPVPVTVVVATQCATLAWLLSSKSGSYARNMYISNVLWNIDSRLPLSKFCSNEVRVGYLAVTAAGGFMAGFTISHRMLLRFLLSYMGWMDEVRGKRSLATTVWGLLLKHVYMRRAATPTFGLQSCLPRQPVPALKDTVDRYLLSMQSLLPPDEFAQVSADAERFQKVEGPKLQRYLKFKYWTSVNYVSDWWLSVVYLRGRESIMINSNYYGLSQYRKPPTDSMAARAATMVRYFMEVKAQIEHEQLPRITIQDIVPICMQQYSGAFCMTRVPGHEEDRLVQYEPHLSRHIVVMCRGRFFKMNVFDHRTGRLLSKVQLEAAFHGIKDACARDSAEVREANFGALTALPRSDWAQIRENCFQRDSINRVALEIIERAAFVVCLEMDQDAPFHELEKCGRMGLHGDGTGRWFDKSFCLIVSRDGNIMVNGEHAWADAPTLGHIFEIAMAREARNHAAKKEYTETGAVFVTPAEADALNAGKLSVYRPERILFNVTPTLEQHAARAQESAQKQIDNLELRCINFDAFGKGRMKKAKVSPDAFVQMALQLAFFRDRGFHTQTYESGMARLYREGRTETIRSASNESVEFVRAMLDESQTDAARLKLLRDACNKHQRTTALAMTGRGVDRHMFALYVVAVGTETDSAFLSRAMKRGWKLSTSQIPQAISNFVNKNDFSEYPRPAGGFGPVAADGYGVCYTIVGEDRLFFHITANKDCEQTDAGRMAAAISQAMHDLVRLTDTA